MSKPLTYKQMADLIADKLTSEELDRLTELLDGDAHNLLLENLNVRNAIKNPQSYVSGFIATPKKRKTT